MKKECVAMLLAGGQGSRLYVLTGSMAKPAVPFAPIEPIAPETEKAAEPDVQTADAGAVRVDIPSQKGMDRVPLVLLAASGIVLVVAGVVTRRH